MTSKEEIILQMQKSAGLDSIDSAKDMHANGIDSLKALVIVTALEKQLGKPLSLEILYNSKSIDDFVLGVL